MLPLIVGAFLALALALPALADGPPDQPGKGGNKGGQGENPQTSQQDHRQSGEQANQGKAQQDPGKSGEQANQGKAQQDHGKSGEQANQGKTQQDPGKSGQQGNLGEPHQATFREALQPPTKPLRGEKPVNQPSVIPEVQAHPLTQVQNELGATFVQTWVYRERRKPVSVPYNNIPEANGTVLVTNIGGLKNLRITVNGYKFQVAGLKDQEIRAIDVSSAMEPGDKNMIVLTALGKPGTSAMVEIGPVSP